MAANDMRGDTFALHPPRSRPSSLTSIWNFSRRPKRQRVDGWLGVVRSSTRTKLPSCSKAYYPTTRAIHAGAKPCRFAGRRTRQLSYGERDQMLRDIYGVVENAGQKWEVLSDTFNLHSTPWR